MAGDASANGAGHSKRGSVYHRQLRAAGTEPSIAFARYLAELNGVAVEEIPPVYRCIAELVESLYSTPPPPEAQAELTFNCEGFRITLYQDGHAVFRELD